MAVYGTLKNGYNNHRLIAQSKWVDNGSTSNSYPFIVDGLPYVYDKEGLGYRVQVEVYDVDDATLKRLDQLEGHPTFYKRKQVDISLSDWTTTKAWVYFINEDWDQTGLMDSKTLYSTMTSEYTGVDTVDHPEDIEYPYEQYGMSDTNFIN